MLPHFFHWRTLLAIVAIVIVTGTVFYSDFLAKKIAAEEKQKIEQWLQAATDLNNPTANSSNLASKILTENSQGIPMITVTENDSILDHYNLDSTQLLTDKNYLHNKLKEFKKGYPPIIWKNPLNPSEKNLVYYGESTLLKQIKYFPLIQLLIVSLFIILLIVAMNIRNKSTQNQVWVGMAKETAHQLGTPISSLQGWVEMLKETETNQSIANEMSKDVNRLQLVSDRFGKIGSQPQLTEANLVHQVEQMVQYIKRRSSERVQFSVLAPPDESVIAPINAPLFDWVIENLLKNALDAMEGNGQITIRITADAGSAPIDISDTGKGISRKDQSKIFRPGFTTKKRGWGLGLSLSKRIIETYHRGNLSLLQTEPGKGTTFRMVLKK